MHYYHHHNHHDPLKYYYCRKTFAEITDCGTNHHHRGKRLSISTGWATILLLGMRQLRFLFSLSLQFIQVFATPPQNFFFVLHRELRSTAAVGACSWCSQPVWCLSEEGNMDSSRLSKKNANHREWFAVIISVYRCIYLYIFASKQDVVHITRREETADWKLLTFHFHWYFTWSYILCCIIVIAVTFCDSNIFCAIILNQSQ